VSIALLVITDGRRDCIAQTIPSALLHLRGGFARKLIYDDSGDDEHRRWLGETFGPQGFQIAFHPAGRQGFGGAIRVAWSLLLSDPAPYRHVFHLEDDFVFRRPVDLTDMAAVLNQRPSLVQLALRRQPWNDQERSAGGIVEMHPGDWVEYVDDDVAWLESRRNFTTNPSLYRRSLCARGWPDCEYSEGIFTHQLLVDPEVRFGYWGARESGEWVEHIGHHRVGVGY
jgi:hypothetical protein